MMNTLARIKLYTDAVNEWGAELQFGMFYEEVGELMQALNKFRRKPNEDTRIALAEEIVDAQIMIEQIAFLTGTSNITLDKLREQKLLRLQERLQ